jgi:hypothetical protein
MVTASGRPSGTATTRMVTEKMKNCSGPSLNSEIGKPLFSIIHLLQSLTLLRLLCAYSMHLVARGMSGHATVNMQGICTMRCVASVPDHEDDETEQRHGEADLADGSGQHSQLLLQRRVGRLADDQGHRLAPLAVLANSCDKDPAVALRHLHTTRSLVHTAVRSSQYCAARKEATWSTPECQNAQMAAPLTCAAALTRQSAPPHQ